MKTSRSPLQQLALAAAVALALALGACGGGGGSSGGPVTQPPPATTGSLAVTVASLPTGVAPALHITGPGGYAKDLTQGDTLTGLAAGSYTVTANSVTVGTTTYVPASAGQTVTVNGGATATVNVTYSPVALALGVSRYLTGLDAPVYLTAPAGDERQFVVERPGRIRVVQNGAVLATPFLDVSSRVYTGGEGGLLSMAFAPDYATSGAFYIYFIDANHDIVVERRTVSGNPNIANGTGAVEIIRIAHPTYTNHFGGQLAFGPDGMLYLGTGDGGGAGDPNGNAKNPLSLLGKMLRLDVSKASVTSPYLIPASNPFATLSSKRGEIWALGLRNPWRFSFDSGQLIIADVGQAAREEVDIVSATQGGLNFGWNVMEGTGCYSGSACSTTGFTPPVFEYSHGTGGVCSITGGYVYRGNAIPALTGHYLYSDYCAGFLRSFLYAGGSATQPTDWGVSGIGQIVSFGQDAQGELYMLSSDGSAYKIVKK
ncbi:glucose dehydrogenase [Massilia arenosa]|uniref:Glucose dehydrogenase n=1 Tax=Zemynaea arenosa TaxID=2561931 RepID=A0A4Y9SH86_9BURK|nr:PQQ-dependent sugar dehydrogenase [Massilia arenosa]TFW20783.1 glucose dehydrogenase [Massilia arenosa]